MAYMKGNKILFSPVVNISGGFTSNVYFGDYLGIDKRTIIQIVNALSNNVKGCTVTFSKFAVDTAFETSTGAADGSTSFEWETGMMSKSNWTFSLI